VKIDATITFEAADDTEGRRKLDAIAVITNCEIEDWTMQETWEGGQVILVPKDRFADEDTNPKSIRISEQDAEVCDKATTVLLNWWDSAFRLDLVPDEGEDEQLRVFPFQRLQLIATRYEEA
jgi:hypothetical protein